MHRQCIQMKSGFTLIELLVVILIISLVSAVALPTVVGSLNTRQVSEAGRLLQGAIAGARDRAIHSNQPCGIRLLPDPAFPVSWVTINGVSQVDPSAILAYNRAIPLESAPEYNEGLVSIFPAFAYSPAILAVNGYPGCPCLVLEECVANPATGAPNPRTSWFWNIRVGDKVQVHGAGPWLTVVGPTVVGPAQGNPELFINGGPPGTALPTLGGGLPCEYLLLVNGRDDNANGWVDEGFDGVDNNGVNGADEWAYNATPPAGEWEIESWPGSAAKGAVNVAYAVRRRPAPSTNAREVALPTAMVIDATTWSTTQERSRLPVDPVTGLVDIVVNPDGTVVPTTIYSSPSSFGMGAAFYHFWLAERQDLHAVNLDAQGNTLPWAAGVAYRLPIADPGGANSATYPGPHLKGGYAVLSLSARTGQVVVNQGPSFLGTTIGPSGVPAVTYNAAFPFIPAEQGVAGGP